MTKNTKTNYITMKTDKNVINIIIYIYVCVCVCVCVCVYNPILEYYMIKHII